jgi:LemA protein
MSSKVLGCSVVLVLILLVGLGLAFFLFGQFNALVADEQAVVGQWAQVESVYQRRADLIPNLVETVRAASEFEQETLNGIVEARSQVGQVSLSSNEILSDPAAFARFQQAQSDLSGALQRLLVVIERYPDLQSVQAFQDLMTQLEGTENRIAVQRMRFNEAARDYNVRLRSVPTRWFVGMLGWGFEERSYFESVPGAEEAPRVDF